MDSFVKLDKLYLRHIALNNDEKLFLGTGNNLKFYTEFTS